MFKKVSLNLLNLIVVICMLFTIVLGASELFADINLLVTSDGLIDTAEKFTLQPYSYNEDFENKDPFVKWASNGNYTVNYKGVTSEKSSSGQKSFKIDITFGTATYVYYQIPLFVPSVGELLFKGDILLDKTSGAKATLGANTSLFPSSLSGVNSLDKQSTKSIGWITQEANLTEKCYAKAKKIVYQHLIDGTHEDVGIWSDRIGLYLYGKKGDTLTVYVDNLKLMGKVPDIEEYSLYSTTVWKAYQNRIEKGINQIVEQTNSYRKNDVDEILNSYKNRGYIKTYEYRMLNDINDELNYLNVGESQYGSVIIYPWDPLTDKKILPTSFPVPALPGNLIQMAACPAEYEAASFIMRSQHDLKNATLALTDLINAKGDLIPSTSFDLKLVKCWYQANNDSVYRSDVKYLTPELLVHDDSLILIDEKNKKNYLKVNRNGDESYIDISDSKTELSVDTIIQDSVKLLPFSMKKGSNKQIWLTAHVPEDAKPGIYRGKIHVTATDSSPVAVDLELDVHDFTLPQPCIEYSMYYTGKLVDDKYAEVGNSKKSKEQYKIELNNLKEHGIASLTLYQKNDSMLPDALKMRSEAGFDNDNLYVLGLWTGNPQSDIELASLKKKVSQWVDYAEEYNYNKVFIYGIDEAKEKIIKSQKKAWEVVHDAGAGIIVACPKNAIDIENNLLNIGVVRDRLENTVARNWHEKGAKVFSYGNPQVGVENPYIYRKNYGIDLWLSEYDGAMNFAYQYDFGNIWNDFDHKIYRDHVFAYPVSNGVVDTIQWEGFREGIDDVRYLSKLLALYPDDKRNIQSWVQQMKDNGLTLGQIKMETIEKIKQRILSTNANTKE
ncbi:MAG: hypothetical protein JEZ12_06270 [Desulfobacterium sp.]|nr:hypothetical protein [Desulfobacterium sp.]